MKTFSRLGVACCLVFSMVSSGVAADNSYEKLLLELKDMVEQQQKQLNNQAVEIERLREALSSQDPGGAIQSGTAAPADLAEDKLVTSRYKDVEVKLYGHINRGALVADNGSASKTYFVDNSNSQSRIGVDAAIKPSDDVSVGGKIEYGVKSNASSDVNQLNTNDATSVNWNLRHADVFFKSDSYGKVSLGHGSAASDGSSEVDLSGTTVVTYSDFGAVAGGQLFYDDLTQSLTDVAVKSAYTNMDGLGRDDRIRIDSPDLIGFMLSGSAISGDAYDVALRYSRDYDGTKVAAAVAWANPGDANSSVSEQINGSMSVLHSSGINATFAAGVRELVADRDDTTFWYVKLGYQAEIFEFGKTLFSVDYADNSNVAQDTDSSKLWSVAAVQNVPDWGTEFYLAYRQYTLDRDLVDYKDVSAILAGARVKF